MRDRDISLLSRFIRGAMSVGIGSGSILILGLLSMIFAIRFIPVDEYGAFVLLLVVSNFLVEISGFGLNLATPKFMAESEDDQYRERLVNSVLIFRVAVSILVSMVGFLTRGWLAHLFGSTTFFDLIIYMPLLVLLVSTSKLQQSILQGLFLFRTIGAANVVASVVNFGLTILLVLVVDLGTIGVVYARVISLGLAVAYMYVSTPLKKRIQIDIRLLTRMIRFGAPLQASYVMTFIFLRIDTLLIATLLGPAQVAYYEVARKIPENATIAYDAFRVVYFPFVAKLFAEGRRQKVASFINQSVRWLSLGGIFGSLIAFLFASDIILLIGSERYLPSTSAFVLLMFGFNLLIIDYTLGYSLVAIGESGKPLYVNIVKATVSLVGNLLFIPSLGIVGAALASIFGYVIGNPLNVIFLRRRGVDVSLSYFLEPFIVAVGLMVMTLVITPDVFIVKVALVSAFPIICLLTSVVDVKEITMAIRELKTALIGSKSIEDEGDESIQRRVVNVTDSLRILLITDTLPYPPVSGNRLRVYHLCQQLAVKHEVWMIAPERPSEPSADAITHLEQFCERVITTPYKKQSKLRHLPGILRYALTGKPPELKFEHSSELLAPLRHLVNTISFDIVHIEPSYIALYREALPPTLKARCVITYQNIDFDLHRRIAQVHANRIWKARAILHSLFMQRWEPRYAGKFTRCITCSERDQRLLLQRNPGASVEVVPNGVDTLAYTPLEPNEGPPAIMFIGSMSYRACADGAVFFHDEALPIVRDYVPDVETWLVGRDPTPDVLALAGARVHVTGWVEDVLPYYMRASLMIVPLRAGGGTRLKILEAMALGRTVVSTSIGCEGLDVVDGEHIMIADDPREFAEKTIALLTDNALCMRLTQNARDLVCKQYDWRLIAEKQIRIYREIVQNGSISVPPPAALSIQLGELSAT